MLPFCLQCASWNLPMVSIWCMGTRASWWQTKRVETCGQQGSQDFKKCGTFLMTLPGFLSLLRSLRRCNTTIDNNELLHSINKATRFCCCPFFHRQGCIGCPLQLAFLLSFEMSDNSSDLHFLTFDIDLFVLHTWTIPNPCTKQTESSPVSPIMWMFALTLLLDTWVTTMNEMTWLTFDDMLVQLLSALATACWCQKPWITLNNKEWLVCNWNCFWR